MCIQTMGLRKSKSQPSGTQHVNYRHVVLSRIKPSCLRYTSQVVLCLVETGRGNYTETLGVFQSFTGAMVAVSFTGSTLASRV